MSATHKNEKDQQKKSKLKLKSNHAERLVLDRNETQTQDNVTDDDFSMITGLCECKNDTFMHEFILGIYSSHFEHRRSYEGYLNCSILIWFSWFWSQKSKITLNDIFFSKKVSVPLHFARMANLTRWHRRPKCPITRRNTTNHFHRWFIMDYQPLWPPITCPNHGVCIEVSL